MLVVSLMFVVLGALASEAAVYKMKIHSVGSDMHASTFALKDFKKYVEEKSKGQIQVSLHINASLGGDRQATEAMQLGTLVSPTASVWQSQETQKEPSKYFPRGRGCGHRRLGRH